MSQLGEAIQISIISIGIVFSSLLIFSLLIQLMGNYFKKANLKTAQVAADKTAISHERSLLEKKKIAAIMALFQEEFGDQLAEIKISRVNRKETTK